FGDDNLKLFISKIMIYCNYLSIEEKIQNLEYIKSLLKEKNISGKYYDSKVLGKRDGDKLILSKVVNSIEFDRFKVI
ncbi:MAG: hypothetical protein ACRDAS_03035, partial [Cetobacterium sp.]